MIVKILRYMLIALPSKWSGTLTCMMLLLKVVMGLMSKEPIET